MAKYYQSDKLAERINWEAIMPLARYAGGHDEQMKSLLSDVTLIGHWNEGDYQGYVATCVQLNDTKEIVIYNDSYGSCSGCDAWEDASDDDVRQMCRQLACGAYVFQNFNDCKEFLLNPDVETSHDWKYSDTAANLLKEIDEELLYKSPPKSRFEGIVDEKNENKDTSEGGINRRFENIIE